MESKFDITKHVSLKIERDDKIHIAEWQMLHLANLKSKVYD